MPTIELLKSNYLSIRSEATQLAGRLGDLSQRATVYHHLFQHSNGNHIFPLIAAHGALWAGAYFRLSEKLANLMSLQYLYSPVVRRERMQQVSDFLDVFRDVNRRVCIQTYTTYHFSLRFGDTPGADEFIPPDLLHALNRCHAARLLGTQLTTVERRCLFEAFFLNEQETVVGPLIESAMEAFDWKLVKSLAMKPRIRFAYLGSRRPLVFRDFSNRQERIEKGMQAFDVAAAVGWSQVESSLDDYDVLPTRFFEDSSGYFASLRNSVLAGA